MSIVGASISGGGQCKRTAGSAKFESKFTSVSGPNGSGMSRPVAVLCVCKKERAQDGETAPEEFGFLSGRPRNRAVVDAGEDW